MGEQFESPNGKYQAASIMPSYAYLSDEEIKDLTAYIQTLGRNKDWRKIDGVPLNDYEKQDFTMNDDNENFLEKTTEIKQGHADVGPFVIGVISTITLICIVYLIVNL